MTERTRLDIADRIRAGPELPFKLLRSRLPHPPNQRGEQGIELGRRGADDGRGPGVVPFRYQERDL